MTVMVVVTVMQATSFYVATLYRPGLVLSKSTLYVVEGSQTATYTVTLTTQPTNAVYVAVSGPARLSVSPAQATFNSSNWAQPRTFTVTAVVRIRQGDRAAHRRWMIRSFALTLAAVTLRLYLPASLAAGLPFETAYPAIAWLCWVPNLIVAEVVVLRRRGAFALAA